MIIWSLACVDDMILLAKSKEALVDMMSISNRFLKDKKLELCTDKTKILVFNSKGKKKKESWK